MISPFTQALMCLIKERFNTYKEIASISGDLAIVIGTMYPVLFIIREDEIYSPFGTVNFDIANPKFDPENIIKWIESVLHKSVSLGEHMSIKVELS